MKYLLGNRFYNLKDSGNFMYKHTENFMHENPHLAQQCSENLEKYSLSEVRTSYKKKYLESDYKGQEWLDKNSSEWKGKLAREKRENYDGDRQLSVSLNITERKEGDGAVSEKMPAERPSVSSLKISKQKEGSAAFSEKLSSGPRISRTMRSVGSKTSNASPPRRHLPAVPSKSTATVPSRHLPTIPTTKSRQLSPSSAISKRTPPGKTVTQRPDSASRNPSSVKLQKSQYGKSTGTQRTPPGHVDVARQSSLLVAARRANISRTPPSHTQVVSTLGKTKTQKRSGVVVVENYNLQRCESEAISPKGYETTYYDKIGHFLGSVDSVKSTSPNECADLFHHFSLDPEVHRVWRFIGHYLLLGDDVIDTIDNDCHFVEEKCSRMLKEWKKCDESADYLELVYAMINARLYGSYAKMTPYLPLSSPESGTRNITVPVDDETLSELEKELIREKDSGAYEAEVILQGKENTKPIVFRLGSMDRDGLRVVDYACMAAATKDGTKSMALTINYMRSSESKTTTTN